MSVFPELKGRSAQVKAVSEDVPRDGDQENRHDLAPPSPKPKHHLELLKEMQISSLHETSLFFTFYNFIVK